jgi:hypothetical protein
MLAITDKAGAMGWIGIYWEITCLNKFKNERYSQVF